MRRLLFVSLAAALLAATAHAKLPALSDEAKAKAADAAAKTAWSDKVGGYQLCQAMNRAADHYRKDHKDAPAAVATPACTDPGAFVPPVPAAPLEAAGAHSPATMATSPPSGKAPAAEIKGTTKK
ncbi:MAG: hypothetical protein ABUL50_08725 [Rhizobacter sp.]